MEHEKCEKYYGKTIQNAWMDKESNRFFIIFCDALKIFINDQGQSCCEHRYMTCDDNPLDLVGKKLTEVKVKNLIRDDGSDDSHEIAFLEIIAGDASVNFATHNEHNGYYGGFDLKIEEVLK